MESNVYFPFADDYSPSAYEIEFFFTEFNQLVTQLVFLIIFPYNYLLNARFAGSSIATNTAIHM